MHIAKHSVQADRTEPPLFLAYFHALRAQLLVLSVEKFFHCCDNQEDLMRYPLLSRPQGLHLGNPVPLQPFVCPIKYRISLFEMHLIFDDEPLCGWLCPYPFSIVSQKEISCTAPPLFFECLNQNALYIYCHIQDKLWDTFLDNRNND